MGFSAAALIAWASAFVLTQAIEVPIYLSALAGRSRLRAVAISAGASAVSHPLLWFVGWPVMRWLYLSAVTLEPRFALADARARYALFVIPLEICVVIGEALYLGRVARMTRRRAFAWSLVANGTSLVVGMALRSAVDWL